MIEFKREKVLNGDMTKKVSKYVKSLNYCTSTTYRYMSSICAFLSTCENPEAPTTEEYAKFYNNVRDNYPQYRLQYVIQCVRKYMKDAHGVVFSPINKD